jgi:hypothetical protein
MLQPSYINPNIEPLKHSQPLIDQHILNKR